MSKLQPYLPDPMADDMGAIHALKAVFAGTASPEQQTYAIHFIVTQLSALNQLSYRPGVDGERDTAFAEGKRFVGHEIMKRIDVDVSKLQQPQGETNARSSRRR